MRGAGTQAPQAPPVHPLAGPVLLRLAAVRARALAQALAARDAAVARGEGAMKEDAHAAGGGERTPPSPLSSPGAAGPGEGGREGGDRPSVDAAPPGLRAIASRFGLDPLEVEMLAVIAAADLDPRVGEGLVAWRPATGSRPSAADLVALLAGVATPSRVLERLSPSAPLNRRGLLASPEGPRPPAGMPALLGQPLRASDAVVGSLVGWTTLDRSVHSVACLEPGRDGRGVEVRVSARALLGTAGGRERAERIAADAAILDLPVVIDGDGSPGEEGRALPAPVGGGGPLLAACRAAAEQEGLPLARRTRPRLGWEDLVLPEAALGQLRALAAVHQHRERVLDQWGFARRGRGRGARGLFHGPPGTGKTLAAEVLARHLGLDLLHVDLSQCVSKWIGETEKNLARAFRTAEREGALLFFDEADALFGERTRASTAQDRYANLEVAFLLQELERTDAVVVLATNLRRNLDDAFARRFHHVVEFPSPDAGLRAQLWARELPASAPFDGDVDPGDLGRRFALAGGSIRNAALRAAFAAAVEDRPISRQDLFRAVATELSALGRAADPRAFHPFESLLDVGGGKESP